MTQRQPRLLDPGYLAWLRTKHCDACTMFPPCDAAHIRAGSRFYKKRSTGMQEKPDDKWAVSLCRRCHRRQHAGDEIRFWHDRGVDPFGLAIVRYAQYGGTGGKPARSRMTKPTAPRKPRHLRAKITSRNNLKRNARCL